MRYVLRLADTSLVLGQRLGEWSGHAPSLEEELALANIALDLIGQVELLLAHAGEIEGRARDADALAFLRDAPDFLNLSLAEQPNGTFADTIMRQCLIDAWQLEVYEALVTSRDTHLAQIVAKAVKETRYHVRFSSSWVVRLGDGTDVSHQLMQHALEVLWPFTDELFTPDAVDEQIAAAGLGPSLALLRPRWESRIAGVLEEATLQKPASSPYPWYGKCGVHTEHLGPLLAVMQHVPRTYLDAKW